MLGPMERRPRVPELLIRGPVTLADGRSHGLHRWNFEGAIWRRIAPGTYLPRSVEETPLVRIEAASRRLPPAAAFSGFTAAWLHGLDVPLGAVEITVPDHSISSRSGMVVRRRALDKDEVVKARGFRTTSVVRTLRDLCAKLPLVEGVVVTDMALHLRLVNIVTLERAATQNAGSQGVRTLRQVLVHAEPATESPMESRFRMLLVLGGLRRPEAQVEIRDRFGRFVARVDLYYREERLALEYDGGIHRETLAEDNRRQNRLIQAGIRLLRFTASDIYNSPDLVISTVRAAFAA